jgi:subtilisin family serine protease
MKATANTYLNVRVGGPGVNVAINGYLKPGDVVEYDELVRGDAIEGNNIWLRSTEGNYLWSGGIDVEAGVVLRVDDSPWWLDSSGILDLTPEERGRGVKIALLDTGIDESRPDIKPISIAARHNVLTGDSNTKDGIGHGTNCAGVMAGWGPTLRGVASGVSLLVCKVTETANRIEVDALVRGIDWAIANDARVISMSLAIEGNYPSDYPTLYQKVKEASDAHIIMVASIGNFRNGGYDIISYPACYYEQCVSVGAIDRKGQITSITASNRRMNLLAPGADMPAIVPMYNSPILNGTSFSAAYMSGLFALLMSVSKKSPEELMKIVLSTPDRFANYQPPFGGPYPIVNPDLSIKKAMGRRT